MPGIKSITTRREEDKNASSGLELWMKDGDQAFVAIVPTGDEEDKRLGDIYVHTVKWTADDGSNRWKDTLCGKTTNSSCEQCNKGQSVGHKWALWAYVYYILHSTKEKEYWERVESKGGKVQFKETVDDIRMVCKGFGRADYLWNQLVEVYNDIGALNKKVVKISRKGDGMKNTSYTIMSIPNDVKLSDDAKSMIAELPSVVDFYLDREKKGSDSDKSEEMVESSAKTDTMDLNFGDDSDTDDAPF